MIQHSTKVGIAICTPIPFVPRPGGGLIKERISVDWHRCRQGLAMPTNIVVMELAADGMEVGVARNSAVQRILEAPTKPEFLFFIDYDVLLPHDALTKLLYRARHFPDYDILCGVYCSKSALPEPLIYKGEGGGPFWDWSMGDLVFDLTSCHMGLTLIRTSLFERMTHTEELPWFLTRNDRGIVNGKMVSNRGTEDIHFCKRAREEVGAKIMADTSVLAGHMDMSSGTVYGLPNDSMPVRRAKWRNMGKEGPMDPQAAKKAIDLGAGGVRRAWDGHEVHTTDIRPDSKPDFVMDSRLLSLPDEAYDLVASSHHLEHIPRWEQDQVWREIFRICKPGGSIEHIVPNIAWAAAHIADGHVDEHVMNVLYGAQEAHGYDRQWNLHYFGYTPQLAKEMAEAAGFVDVKVTSFRDEPALGYNLWIRGNKPPAKMMSDGNADDHRESGPERAGTDQRSEASVASSVDRVPITGDTESKCEAVRKRPGGTFDAGEQVRDKWPTGKQLVGDADGGGKDRGSQSGDSGSAGAGDNTIPHCSGAAHDR